MKTLLHRFFFRTTIAGMFALLPFLVIGYILFQAYQFVYKIGEELINDSDGKGVDTILLIVGAVVFIILLCFFVGWLIVPRGEIRAASWLERNVLGMLPGYLMIKGVATGVLSEGEQLTPAYLHRFPGIAEFVLIIEHLPDDKYVVFLPNAPTSTTGTLMIVDKDKLEPLEADIMDYRDVIGSYGFGVSKVLRKK